MKYTIIVDKQSSSNPSSEKKEYTIDIEELRTYNGISDTLTVTTETAYVTRRLQLSEYGILSVLPAPKKEEIKDLNITLFEGENYIYILNAEGNKISLSYVIKNDFTDTYPTKSDMKSSITQTAQSIELSVNQKLTGYSTTEQMNAAIQLSANSITSTVSKTYATKTELTTAKSEIKQTTDSITSTVSQKVGKTEIPSTINQTAQGVKISAEKLDLSGLVTISNLQTAGKTTINGSNITTGTIDASKVNVTNLNASNIKSGTITGRAISGGTITGTQITNGNNFSVDKNGNLNCSNANITGGRLNLSNATYDAPKFITSGKGLNGFNGDNTIYADGMRVKVGDTTYINLSLGKIGNNPSGSLIVSSPSSDTYINAEGITTPTLQQTSLESIKKNISHYNENALKTILNSDIYSYNLKTEKDTDKKHIGFVIGDKYKPPKEVMKNEGNAIELYSAIGILWKGMQEQQKKIEELENKLKEVTNG